MIFAVIAYVFFLFLISRRTSLKANDSVFYTGNRQSPWYIVAYGMIGASLSGVTFLSQPGWVGATQFSYMMMVFGFVAGYAVIALVLLPLYYRLNLTSIYTYLEGRFGSFTYKTGASFFIVSRGIGAALRMFISVYVLDLFVFMPLGIPFWLLALISTLLVLLYTFRGGIRTIVWTDALQTSFMLLSVVVTIFLVCISLEWSFFDMVSNVKQSEYSAILVTDWTNPRFFLKQFVAGVFVTIAMTGLDQDMMQKNLSCRNLRDAQKNMFTFSIILIVVNLMFLLLGAVLHFYAASNNIAVEFSDRLFPTVSINHLGAFAGIVFLIGLIASTFSSADGALTALTTSFCIDIIGLDKRKLPEKQKFHIRYVIHFLFAALFFLVILSFNRLENKAIIDRFFTIAGYTYGPLLGLYSFGLFTKWKVIDRAVPIIAVISPIVTYILDSNSNEWLNGYQFGFELLLLNGLLTFAGLIIFVKKKK